jgi:putative ABC transport system permease protein
MYYKTVLNDMRKSKAISFTTMMFVAAASMLISLAAILVVNLSGAIDTLMAQAKTPHFMQMHAGIIDLPRLTSFAEQNGDVADFQVLEFLNMDGGQIVFESGSLAGSIQDNGFSVQSEKFDFLLDLNGNIITVLPREIFIPISYMQDGTAKIGDRVSVNGREFVIAGALRDSQMNSLLSSSKRFLVNQSDFTAIKESGSMEYLIEFRLKDLSTLAAFETSYAGAGLEANGPTLTYPLFKSINAISDGMMAAVILLVSALVIGIAFLCIRFTLLAKIEDDYREIGVMKAIGLRVSDIKKIYLAKYASIAGSGCLLGFALSFVFRDSLLQNIRLYMGESENASLAPILGSISVLLLFIAVVAYVNSILQQFRKISPVEAIRFGIAQERISARQRFQLNQNWLLGTNIFLGINDVLARKSLYATMLVVLVLSVFMINLPQNLHNTISSKSFIAYMGVGSSDIRIDIQQTDRIAEKSAEIAQAMKSDTDITQYVVLTTKSFRVMEEDGSETRITVELGDHMVFPINYSEGRAPITENEIALSVLNAKEMDKQIGDAVRLTIDGRRRNLTVSGIYSDITNGGKTAKAVFQDDSAIIMWSVISAELSDPSLVSKVKSVYADRFSFAKVSSVGEYVDQTFGATIRSIKTASLVAIAVALVITSLITLLFMRMLIRKDRYSIAVMKAFGFTNTDITLQYISRSVFVLLAGILLGVLFANSLGEFLAGAAIALFGASTFKFTINPVLAYLVSPLMMAGVVLAATVLGTLDAGHITIAENIKE